MKIAVLLRGYHYLARDRFGFPVDGRRYAASLLEKVLTPLRSRHEVTVFAATYPSGIQAELFRTLGVDHILQQNPGTATQISTFLEGLRQIESDPSGFDRIISTRFDLLYKKSALEWSAWAGEGVYFPWREYEGFWQEHERVGDFIHVVDRPYLRSFIGALESLSGAVHIHQIYRLLREQGIPVHFLEPGFHDSNTMYGNPECENPLYTLGNRPRLPLPNPARPPDDQFWLARKAVNRLTKLITISVAWYIRSRSHTRAS